MFYEIAKTKAARFMVDAEMWIHIVPLVSDDQHNDVYGPWALCRTYRAESMVEVPNEYVTDNTFCPLCALEEAWYTQSPY